jgi:alkylated DNA repair dioxygenase AlkB
MNHLIDLERYPLDRLDSDAGNALLARCRDELERDGLFNLAGLLRAEVVAELLRELRPLMASASFTHRRRHNIYFLPQVDDLPAEHPALQQLETVNHTLCADQFAGNALMQLYEWPPFARFLAAVMEIPHLYPMDDPLACLNVMAYREGEALNWHFDRSEFTTTLLLQSAEQGGEFEYRTGLRDDRNPNYAGIGEFLAGDQGDVRRLELSAGTLNVFRGKNTLHRVSPVRGEQERMIAVFSYYERPDVQFSREENLGFYGRTNG